MNRLREILALHFDPSGGSPYWLLRERALGWSVRAEIQSIDDLGRLGPFDLGDLARYPVTDFVPRSLLGEQHLVMAESGGTTGTPATTAYTQRDFESAFIEPFLDTLGKLAIFDGGYWLWLGPGGPHIIGKAAQRIAALTTGADAFSVDFDPRWYRRLMPGSLARMRYLDHVLEHALRIAELQDVRYLFGTPVVLQELATRLSQSRRLCVKLLYLGGMPVSAEVAKALRRAFPHALFLAGYGNTLFGVCHERAPSRLLSNTPSYYAQSPRLIVRVVELTDRPPAERVNTRAPLGTRGQLMMHRLDPSGFLPCVLERDSAVRLADSASQDGLGEPQPLANSNLKIDHGIY